jgi:polyprenyl P-hydroxybenzoate/phenylacrylic acid decarboxylase-like protein
MRIVVCITGSSGAVYADSFLRKSKSDKYLVVSKWGRVLLKDELDISEKELLPYVKRQFSDDDLTSPLASGSNHFDACVILPCSTSTMGKIAAGIGDTLVTRTAQVALKERFKLVLCVRETPWSTITLEQAAMLSRAGAIIMPISPPLYFKPKTVDEYVSSFTDKLMAILGEGSTKGWRSEELE